ncbi:cytochrome P450 [Favolaschia claudopus]|uniref:Cytochrome P450 n=1 Tax=Favolaschia claudopus TaxID=2862362 RepID=A0AAW0AM57_9AGAR
MSPPLIFALCPLLLCIVWHVFRRLYLSFALHNVPGPPSDSFTAGNLARLHGPDSASFHEHLEKDFNGVVRIHALLSNSQLYISDPVALHSVLIKDRECYEASSIFLSLSELLFGKGLLSTTGHEHRRYRKIMMPAFSASNLREMVPILYEVAYRLRDGLIQPQLKHRTGKQEVDLYPILSRASLESIGRAALGHSFDSLSSTESTTQLQIDPYVQALKSFTPIIHKLAAFLPLLPIACKVVSPAFCRRALRFLPSSTIAVFCDIVDVMESKSRTLVRDKMQKVRSDDDSHDVMSSWVKNMNLKVEENMKFTEDELVAHASMIIHAGTDTTSSALNRIIHVLALNPEVQIKLRTEIMQTKEELMSYDELVGLPYLDAVIREMLRLYPPVTGMTRTSTHPHILPLSQPIIGVDSRPMDAILISRGTEIYISIAGVNRNEAVWGPDAREFRPERWRGNGQADWEGANNVRTAGVYGNMMTFAGGGRSCIGFKFVPLQLKVVISVLLRRYKFSVVDDRIEWKMGSPAEPKVDGCSALPIIVETLEHCSP